MTTIRTVQLANDASPYIFKKPIGYDTLHLLKEFEGEEYQWNRKTCKWYYVKTFNNITEKQKEMNNYA